MNLKSALLTRIENNKYQTLDIDKDLMPTRVEKKSKSKREYQREYDQRNKERIRQYQKIYKAKNRERLRVLNREYYHAKKRAALAK